jgi:hypothetical protein
MTTKRNESTFLRISYTIPASLILSNLDLDGRIKKLFLPDL